MGLKQSITLLGIFSKFNNIYGRKRIQKIVCIIQNSKDEVKNPFNFEFIKYHYGPYSFDLRDTIKKLVDLDLLEEKRKNKGYEYKISKEGKEFFKSNKKHAKNTKTINKFIKKNKLTKIGINKLVKISKEKFQWN